VGTVEEIRNTTDPIVRQFIEGRPNLDSDEGPEHLTTKRFIRDVDTEAPAERRSGVERRT
jgi:hypothetical protein